MTAQFQSNVICTSHAPTRTKMVFRATHTNTVDDSPLYVQLFTCRIQFQARMSTKSSEPVLEGGTSKARVTFMRDLLRKTRYFPASAAANKGGHISSPLYSLPCNANFRFSLRKTGHNDASYARPRKITTTSHEKWRNLENGNELNVIKTQKISCPTLVWRFWMSRRVITYRIRLNRIE